MHVEGTAMRCDGDSACVGDDSDDRVLPITTTPKANNISICKTST